MCMASPAIPVLRLRIPIGYADMSMISNSPPISDDSSAGPAADGAACAGVSNIDGTCFTYELAVLAVCVVSFVEVSGRAEVRKMDGSGGTGEVNESDAGWILEDDGDDDAAVGAYAAPVSASPVCCVVLSVVGVVFVCGPTRAPAKPSSMIRLSNLGNRATGGCVND